MSTRTELVKACAVTAELTGTEMTDAAAEVMVDDLSVYPPEQVFGALHRCRRELKGRLTLAEIISRLDDGRPGPQEAWAMIPRNEYESTLWTAEMREAFGVANRLIEEGDEIAARMAFLETYQAAVTKARAERRDPEWQVTFGYSDCDEPAAVERRRRAVLQKAVQKGRLTHETAQRINPEYSETVTEETPRLEGPRTADATPMIDDMRRALKGEVGEYVEGMRELQSEVD